MNSYDLAKGLRYRVLEREARVAPNSESCRPKTADFICWQYPNESGKRHKNVNQALHFFDHPIYLTRLQVNDKLN